MTLIAAPELRLPELPDRYNAAETFIDAHRNARPERIAIRCRGEGVTFADLGANVDRTGHALRSLGIAMEQRVVVLVLDSPAFVYSFFGAFRIGAIPIPSNTVLPPRDLLGEDRAAS